MSYVTVYDKPYPHPDSIVADHEGKCCPDSRDGWGCTREEGHTGDHQAANLRDLMVASWRDSGR